MRAVGGEEGFELLLRLGVLAGAIGVDRGVELLLRRVGEVDSGAGDRRRAGDVGRRDVGDDLFSFCVRGESKPVGHDRH